MKLHLLVVGRTVDTHLNALITDYVSRIKHYIPFELEVIPELKNTKALSTAQQKEREGQLILKSLKEGDWVVLMDEGGKEYRSIEFADYLHRRQSSVSKRMVLIIGGPYGFSSEIYALAKEKLSLSKLTFSHQMVRLFLTEQIYRAMTILRDEPYHHE